MRTIDDPIYGSKSIEESAKTTRVFSKKVKEIAKQCNEKYGRPAGSAHTPWQQKEKMIKDWMHEVSSCINSKQSEIKANIHLDDQSRIISMDEHNCREWQKSYKLSEDQLRDHLSIKLRFYCQVENTIANGRMDILTAILQILIKLAILQNTSTNIHPMPSNSNSIAQPIPPNMNGARKIMASK
ncbi:hypothetical protein [Helicobacter suis]|uniref:hypothetical protein n=1 Tax=Helicobacter suis TaxID=104628 RepID=UPI002209F32A|nr:hypothetical protein [Helicobacter suis]BDR29137.1 hypothetical protein HSHS1_18980 [Helicobacter suis HS1]